jgi:hypothetical protein
LQRTGVNEKVNFKLAHDKIRTGIYQIRWQEEKEINRDGATSCGLNRRAPTVAEAGCARLRRVYKAEERWAGMQTNIEAVITTSLLPLSS